MGKRGMSAEQKKAKMKQILQDGKAPYTLKQLEKIGSKAGVNQMSIKGTIEELVDDNLVDMDKIGSTNWYWSFPSKELNMLQVKLKAKEAELEALEKEIENSKKQKEELMLTRKPNEKREALMKELDLLNKTNKEKTAKLEEMKKNDPNNSLDIIKMLEVCKKAAIRWTDNTWALEGYLRKKYQQSKRDVQQMLQMKEDFDYPEYVPPRPKKKAKKKN